MWINKIKFGVSLQIKEFQCRWDTWRKSREIAKAYGEKKTVAIRVFLASLALVVVCALGVGGIMYLSSHHGNVLAHSIEKIRPKATFAAVSQWFEHMRATIARIKIPEKAIPPSPLPDSKGKALLVKQSAPPSASLIDTLPAARPESLAAPVSRAPLSSDTAVQRKKSPGLIGSFPSAMNYCILANKANRTLYLLGKTAGEETWKSMEHFSILVGRNDGQKMSEGDKRTPEGIYFIVGRKETEELNAIYGPLAYMLNYPNEEDRKAGRTGQGIWIHGTREDTTREATRGCVVLNNDNILTLASYLQLGIGTPVVIINNSGLTAPEKALDFQLLRTRRERILTEYISRRVEFEGLLAQWKEAWESRNIEQYSRFYDFNRFFGEGMRWDAWREKKQRTFQTYSMINIGIDKVSVSEFSETTAVILFIQRYESNVIKVQRPKKLSFFKSEGGWKIFKEETFSRQELLL
jgi:murein L,D-transpeptidase YafK